MNVASVLQLLKGGGAIVAGGKSLYDKDYAGVAANIQIAVQGFVMSALSRETAAAETKAMMSAKPTIWLEAGLAAYVFAEVVNGVSKPETGASLTAAGAAPNFDTAIQSLKLALPEESRWSGEAASAYIDVINKVKDCVEAVKLADEKLHSAVAAQADRIMWSRGELHVAKMVIIHSFYPCCKIYLSTLAAENAKMPPNPAAIEVAKLAAKAFSFKILKAVFGFAATFTAWNYNCVFDEATATMSTVIPMYTEAKVKTPLPSSRAVPKASPATSGPTTAPTFRPPASPKPYPVAGGTGDSGRSSPTAQHPAQPTGSPNLAAPAPAEAPSAPVAPVAPATSSTTPAAPVTPAANSTTPPAAQVPQPAAPVAGQPVPKTDARGPQGAGRAPINEPTADPARQQRPRPAARTPHGRHRG
jgi:hypothetical protein